MDRRNFIKKSVGAGFFIGSSALATQKLLASELSLSPYDLVAVKGGEPDLMFDKAIAAMGGMSNYVKKGQSVVVKPNIGWDADPERAANTNPELIKRIIEQCFNAGAKEVYVFDHTCDTWNKCYTNSGIERAAKDAGAKVVAGNSEGYYQEVSVPGGKSLKQAKVHELILDTDVFINVPVLKHHSSARVTISMKNLMGIVWDRRYWHKNDLHQCIADMPTFRKPDLNIVDAYAVMKRNGPRGVSDADVVPMKSLIMSPDIVAADAAAAMVFGSKPGEIPHIRIADEMKVGNMNLDQLSIKRIKV